VCKCTKFGPFVFRNIIKFVASRCYFLWLKCIKFAVVCGSVPDPARRAHSATPASPLDGLIRPTSRERERRKEREGRREGSEWKGKERRRKKGRETNSGVAR